MIEIAPSPLADMKVYLDGDGTPEGMVLMNYYQRYQQEKSIYDHPGMEAFCFARFLLEDLEEYQAEVNAFSDVGPLPPT